MSASSVVKANTRHVAQSLNRLTDQLHLGQGGNCLNVISDQFIILNNVKAVSDINIFCIRVSKQNN